MQLDQVQKNTLPQIPPKNKTIPIKSSIMNINLSAFYRNAFCDMKFKGRFLMNIYLPVLTASWSV